jgi:uncharacterized protein GlcG (DUF336 family)
MEMILDSAKKVVEAAEKKAKEIKVPMNIAVVDKGGNLVAFEKMDNAWLGSINIAINKAFTAVAFNMTTRISVRNPNQKRACLGYMQQMKEDW